MGIEFCRYKICGYINQHGISIPSLKDYQNFGFLFDLYFSRSDEGLMAGRKQHFFSQVQAINDLKLLVHKHPLLPNKRGEIVFPSPEAFVAYIERAYIKSNNTFLKK